MKRMALDTGIGFLGRSKTGLCLVAGEITTNAYVDVQKLVRETIRGVGYTDSQHGFDCDTCGVISSIHGQSPACSLNRTCRLATASADSDRARTHPATIGPALGDGGKESTRDGLGEAHCVTLSTTRGGELRIWGGKPCRDGEEWQPVRPGVRNCDQRQDSCGDRNQRPAITGDADGQRDFGARSGERESGDSERQYQ